MRVLVTGGSGFIGTNLVEHFCTHGAEVLNIDVVPPRNSAHVPFWQSGDLLDGKELRSQVRGFAPEIIFHMAARTDLDGKSVDDYAANIVGVENLICAVDGMKSLRSVIFASSRLVCRIGYEPRDEFDYCPTTPYGESKILGERLVRGSMSRLPCSSLIVRPTSIWGPWFEEPYKTFFLSIYRCRYVHPGSSRILKSFGFVGNTVHQLVRLIDVPSAKVAGRTFYLADYQPIDVAVMATAIQEELGVTPIRRVPVSMLRPVAWAGDLLKQIGWRNPPLTTFRLDNLLTPMIHDLDSLQSVVGALPYSMQQGVRTTVDWLRAQGEIS